MRAEAADFLNDRTTPVRLGDILVPRCYAYLGHAYRIRSIDPLPRKNEDCETQPLQSGTAEFVGECEPREVNARRFDRLFRWDRWQHYCAVDDSEADQFTPEEYAIYCLGEHHGTH